MKLLLIYIYEEGKVLPGDLKFVLDRAKSSRGNFSINPSTSLPAVRLGLSDLVFPGQWRRCDVTGAQTRSWGRSTPSTSRGYLPPCSVARFIEKKRTRLKRLPPSKPDVLVCPSACRAFNWDSFFVKIRTRISDNPSILTLYYPTTYKCCNKLYLYCLRCVWNKCCMIFVGLSNLNIEIKYHTNQI